MKAELHPRESERLAALRSYGVLDTPREAAFDEVVEVLSAICDVPVSVINFIDSGRQWFKAEVGLGVRQTPLDPSICAHAILEGGLVIVPDTLEDPRFRANPLVTGEPHLRFYAGALLETADGLPLGTVCVLDTKPRQLEERQKRAIQLMARQVMRQLELGRMLEAEQLARSRAELLAEQNAILAREIDHRVKNSLQLVSSLLALQGRQAKGTSVKAQLAEAESRVRAIAAVHNELHRAANSNRVAIDRFLDLLCREIAANRPANVEVTCAAAPAAIRSDQASAVGLLVNELIANAFKHAFPDSRGGVVRVLGVRDGSDYVLEVCDDGIGIAPATRPTAGLGMRVLAALAQRLEANLEPIDMQKGAGSRVRFTLPDQSAASLSARL